MSSGRSFTVTGDTPTVASPMQAAANGTTFTDSWPSCDQYTSCSRKILANSSSTSEAPTPTHSAGEAGASRQRGGADAGETADDEQHDPRRRMVHVHATATDVVERALARP